MGDGIVEAKLNAEEIKVNLKKIKGLLPRIDKLDLSLWFSAKKIAVNCGQKLDESYVRIDDNFLQSLINGLGREKERKKANTIIPLIYNSLGRFLS